MRAPFPIDRRSPGRTGPHPEQEKMAPAAGNSAIRRTERRRIARSITTRPPVRPPEEVRRAETRPGRNRNRMSPPPRGSPGKRPASSPKFRNIPPLYGRGSRISNGHTEQTARTRPYDGSSPFAAELVLISRKPVSRYRPEAAPFLYFDGIVSAAAITLRLRIARVEATSGIR